VELVLILILINVEHWFNEPFSVLHVFSWLALLASLLLAIHGFYLLRVIGRPQGSFEDTTKLVTLGAYKYIRHPLYCSLLLGAWGAFLKDVSPLSIGLVIAASAFLVETAKVEETENVKRFGQEYADYMKETKMFIPFLY
ncbi:MAG: isoprenylcysteine carboxylmethyltransferase family protein, partial [Bacteroidota bacterium]